MKIEFSVKQPSRCRTHTTSIELPAYYGVEAVIQELDRVLEYHTMKHEEQKKSFIAKWGIEMWNKMVESEAK